MKQHNANLRILAAAYHQGVINQEQYLALRNQQLGAIQYHKEFPPLPKLVLQCQESMSPQVLVQAAPKRKLWPRMVMAIVLLLSVLWLIF